MLYLITISENERNCTDAKPKEMLCLPSGDVSTKKLDEEIEAECTVFHSTICNSTSSEDRKFKKQIPYRYCFEVDPKNIECEPLTDCTPSLSQFSVHCWSNVPCIGSSLFDRQGKCSRSSKSQQTAFLLSLFLGGFGADLFYLGYYVSASFKLVTLGGL